MISKIKVFFSLDNLKANKKFLIYLFFVCISTVFWFLNALSKEYTTNIIFPVRYVDFPKGKILTNKLPKHLVLSVKSYGFELIRYKMMSFLPITLSVNSLSNSVIERKSLSRYSLVSAHMKNRISRKLGAPLSLVDIKPDTIHFEFSNIETRIFPVKLNLKYSLAQQYKLKSKITLSPDSVSVLGPEIMLDSISCIETEYKNLVFVDGPVNETLSLKKHLGLEMDISKVKINISVEKFTEASKIIPIYIKNMPDSIILRLFPAYVKVSYLVGLSKYGNVSVDDFSASINYENIKPGLSNLKINFNSDNNEISNISFSPKSVSFFKEKKTKE